MRSSVRGTFGFLFFPAYRAPKPVQVRAQPLEYRHALEAPLHALRSPFRSCRRGPCDSRALLTDDTQIVSTAATTNYGYAGDGAVNSTTSTLLKFDVLDMLPANVTAAMVSRARLAVFTGAVTTPGTFNAYQVQSTRSEYGVTYATRPTVGTSICTASEQPSREFPSTSKSRSAVWCRRAGLPCPSSNFGLELKPIGSTNFAIDTKDSTTHKSINQSSKSISPARRDRRGRSGPAKAVQGPKGATGATGPQGPKGATGTLSLPYAAAGTANGAPVFWGTNTGNYA